MMKILAKQLLEENDSYIEALKIAIQGWENADDLEFKREYMVAIGEIGKEVDNMNKTLGLR